ncbi:MAG: DUF72 domain-containing protein [Candidatus Helarchaeota archaeon]
MKKIGCFYSPKVTRAPISEYPKYFQLAELGNTFYRDLPKKEIDKLAKYPGKYDGFEFILKMNRFITHKYMFLHSQLRDKAIDIFEKVRKMTFDLNSNKILMETHFLQEFNDNFFKNFDDFFNSVDLKGLNLFWEFRGYSWQDKTVLSKLKEKLTEYNIAHCIDILYSKPFNFNKEGIVYTRLHGFGDQLTQYIFKTDDMLNLIKESDSLLEENKAVYIIFNNEEMYNDALYLQKILENLDNLENKKIDLENYVPSFDVNFTFDYISTGQYLAITYTPQFAIHPQKDKIKISSIIIKNMGKKIQEYIQILNSVMGTKDIDNKLKKKYFDELRKLGEYLLKYLMGDKINYRSRLPKERNMIIKNEIKNISYPFELIFNKRHFICIRNNLIRKYNEENELYPESIPIINKGKQTRLLFIYKMRNDTLKEKLEKFKQNNCELVILNEGGQKDLENELNSGYDIITYLGNFNISNGEFPETSLKWGKSLITMEDIFKSNEKTPRLFILGNNLQNKKIEYLEHSFYNSIPVLKARCNFLTNFISLTREDILEFIIEFYKILFKGIPIAKALNRTRQQIFEKYWGLKYSWFSFALFGDENSKIGGI